MNSVEARAKVVEAFQLVLLGFRIGNSTDRELLGDPSELATGAKRKWRPNAADVFAAQGALLPLQHGDLFD